MQKWSYFFLCTNIMYVFINRSWKRGKRIVGWRVSAQADLFFKPNVGFVPAVDMHQQHSALYWEQTDRHTHTHSNGIIHLQRSCKRGTNYTFLKSTSRKYCFFFFFKLFFFLNKVFKRVLNIQTIFYIMRLGRLTVSLAAPFGCPSIRSIPSVLL